MSSPLRQITRVTIARSYKEYLDTPLPYFESNHHIPQGYLFVRAIMIRSFRAASVCELRLGQKRRWTSRSPQTSVHPISIRRITNYSIINDAILSRHCTSRKNRIYTHKTGMYFFSTKGNGISKNNETEKGPEKDENATTQSPPSVWEQLQSVPNIITLSRLASTPILCYWIINDEPNLAIVGCAVAGLSDVLDGYIAKNHGGGTVLGTYLDPFADKFFINSLAISLWYSGILPTPLVSLWACKDVLLLGGMGWFIYQEQRTINFFKNSIHTKPLTVTPSTLGKANTGLQFATLAAGILTPVVSPEILPPIVLESLCWVTGASAIVTTLSYAGGEGFKYTSKKR